MQRMPLPRRALLLAILLGACAAPPTPAPPAGTVLDPARVQGEVAGATFPTARASLAGPDGATAGTVGTLSSPATVLVPLTDAPAADRLDPLPPAADGACTFTGTGGPANVGVWDRVEITSAAGDTLGSVREVLTAGQPDAGAVVVRVYSDAATTVRGRVACPGQDSVTYDVTLAAGWNVATRSVTPDGVTVATPPATARSELRGELATPAVTLALAGDGLRFPDAAPVAVRATFTQVGGYSGRVHLATDVPGLSVQPSAVTLPPLGLVVSPTTGPALGAQQLGVTLSFRYAPGPNVDRPVAVIVTDDAGREVGRAATTVQVTRPGFTLSTRTPDVELAAGGTTLVPVCALGTGDYVGPVTLGAETLPAGVTATPTTVVLDGPACGLVALRADGTLRGGTSDIVLTGVGGGYRSTLAARLLRLGPAVSVAFAQAEVPAYRGGSVPLEVTVTGEFGFAGTATLTATGLPRGAVAAPLTVTVPPGGSVPAAFMVQVAPDAALGTFTVGVGGPDVAGSAEPPALTLRVRPPRAQAADGALLTAGAQGVWQRTTLAAVSTLTRSAVAGGTLAVQVPGAVDHLVGVPGGVLALDRTGRTGHRVGDDGNVTPLPALPFEAGDDLADVADSAGRVWFTRAVAAGRPPTIAVWTPASGEVRTVDAKSVTSTYGTRVTLSPDRRTVLVVPRYAGVALTVDTVGGTVTRHSVPGGFSSAAVADGGDVWFAGYNTLTRSGPRGPATVTNVPTGQLLAFDATTPGLLWGRDASTVYRIDTASGTSTAVHVSDASALRAVTAPDGGVDAVVYDIGPDGTEQAYVTVIR